MCCQSHKPFQMFLLCVSIQMHKTLEVFVGYWRFQGKASSFHLFVRTLEPTFLGNPNFFLVGNRRHHDPFSSVEISAYKGPQRVVGCTHTVLISICSMSWHTCTEQNALKRFASWSFSQSNISSVCKRSVNLLWTAGTGRSDTRFTWVLQKYVHFLDTEMFITFTFSFNHKTNIQFEIERTSIQERTVVLRSCGR